jgi:hypothetical protein
LKELEKEATHSFSNNQLAPLLKFANTKSYEAVKLMVRTLSYGTTVDDMAAILEDIEIKLNDKAQF